MPMTPFDFDSRTRVLFGAGTLDRLGEMAREIGGKHALLVTDPGLKAAGHEQRAIDRLNAAGLKISLFDDVHPNPTTIDIERGVAFARPLNVDLLIGLGGGSSMDCAKGINFLLTNGGRMQDYRGTGKATKPMLPLIAVPTTAGTGSEAQSYAVISDAETHMKMACGDKKALARVAILDPELTVTMPFSVTAATGVDALSHAVETIVTKKRNPVSQMFSRQAWQLLSQSLATVLSEPENVTARGAMQLGAYFAGAAIENSMLGATHALANPLSAHFDLVHGIAVGVLLPFVVQYNARDDQARATYLELASLAGIESDSEAKTIQQLVELLRKLTSESAGQPLTLGECDVSREMLPKMADEAAQQWTGQFNPRPVTAQSLLEIYQCAFDGTDVTF